MNRKLFPTPVIGENHIIISTWRAEWRPAQPCYACGWRSLNLRTCLS